MGNLRDWSVSVWGMDCCTGELRSQGLVAIERSGFFCSVCAGQLGESAFSAVNHSLKVCRISVLISDCKLRRDWLLAGGGDLGRSTFDHSALQDPAKLDSGN